MSKISFVNEIFSPHALTFCGGFLPLVATRSGLGNRDVVGSRRTEEADMRNDQCSLARSLPPREKTETGEAAAARPAEMHHMLAGAELPRRLLRFRRAIFVNYCTTTTTTSDGSIFLFLLSNSAAECTRRQNNVFVSFLLERISSSPFFAEIGLQIP